MDDFDDITIPMKVLICDPAPYLSATLEQILAGVEKVFQVESTDTIEGALRLLRGGPMNTIFVDPIGLGLDECSDFIFGIRDVFPEIVFVLYVDGVVVRSMASKFYAGRRQRFSHYFVLDKRTAMLLFEEEVYAVLRGVQFDLHGNVPRTRLVRLLEEGQRAGSAEGQPAVPPSEAGLREIFSLNLGALRTQLVSRTQDDTVRHAALALLEELSRIDRIGKIDAEAAIAKARAVTESMVSPLYTKHIAKKPKPLFEMIEELRERGLLPAKVWSLLHTVRVVGNLSVHYRSDALETVTPSDVSLIGMITAQIIQWYITSDL